MVLGWIITGSILGSFAGYITVSTLAALRLTQTVRRLPDMEPSDRGLQYEDVWFKARGEKLNIAAWYIPAEHASRAIIIAHGIGGCRGRDYTLSSLHLVTELIESGFSVLMIDMRGHGESDAARMTYGMNERRDVLGAVDWLLGHGYAPGSIGVLGLSMGGVAGIGAASEEPAIGALVIDSSCADFLDMMRAHFQRFSKLPPIFLHGAVWVAQLLAGANLAKLRPAATLAQLHNLPTLVFHGARDRIVPLEHGQALAHAAKTEIVIAAKAGHLGSFKADPRGYSRRVLQFFSTALDTQRAVRPIPQYVEQDSAWVQGHYSTAL